ncbi:MAG: metal ABC transporter substrate-binding protein [Spirochaetaceae bacterium]|nr:metal ABC transporter substrate-binding protein [Spirochaetaceae bacterium]
MRRFLFFILPVFIIMSGCVKKEQNVQLSIHDGEKLRVTTTIFPPFDFAREIAGDKIDLTMLLPPGSESHSYDPSPRDIITLKNSDVFIYGGGESDHWIDNILSSMDTSSMSIIKMMDVTESVAEEIVEGMEGAEDEVDYEVDEEEGIEYDEHVWTSPVNAIRIVEAISKVFCARDKANADYYTQRTAAYIAKLSELDAAFRDVVLHGKRKVIVFGDRFPFRYFTDLYGLEYFAAFPGCSTESEPSAATIAFLVRKVEREKIPVVFHIELSNERMADMISSETGAKKLLFNSGHNISRDDFKNGVTFLELQTRNIENLREALN